MCEREGSGDACRPGDAGAGRGLASERMASSAPGPARGSLPRGAGRHAPASEAARTRPRPCARPRSARGPSARPARGGAQGPRCQPAPRRAGPGGWGPAGGAADGMYLVDPASSHMLVSKAKPCTCKHRPPHGEAANGSLDRLQFIRSYTVTWITVVILELIHATSAPSCLAGRGEFIRSKPTGPRGPSPLVTQDNFGLMARPWCRRRIFQVSALSSSVCRCPAYIAADG